MDKKKIESKIQELKLDYIRLQNDLEKLDSVHGNISPLEEQISALEEELRDLNKKLREM